MWNDDDQDDARTGRRHRDDAAGVGEFRAVAERILAAGSRLFESGRDALRRGRPDDAERGRRDSRHGHHAGDHAHARRDDRWRGAGGYHVGPDEIGERSWRDADAHLGRRGGDAGPYAPDEYGWSETGHHAGGARTGHDYDDHRARDFDARAMALQAERERRLDRIGPYARESGRAFGPGAHARDGRGDEPLPGSFGYGGEYRRAPGSAPRPETGGGYRGRGPKGYRRSDERILEEVNERLCDDALVDASGIEVHCQDGRVVLGGQVDARWMKHRAEDIADAVTGVREIENRIRVVAENGSAEDAAARDTARAAGSARDAARDAPASASAERPASSGSGDASTGSRAGKEGGEARSGGGTANREATEGGRQDKAAAQPSPGHAGHVPPQQPH
jgi:hypothetical protein